MRIFLNDYGGYTFPLQLSRELASRGHFVQHAYSGSIISARGALARRAEDPPELGIEKITVSGTIESRKFIRRVVLERRYGAAAAHLVEEFRPDVLLSGNTPPVAQKPIVAAGKRAGASIISWLHDIYAVGAKEVLKRRLPMLGAVAARWVGEMERRQLLASDHVVSISHDFEPHLHELGIGPASVSVVPNWAPLNEVPLRPRRNDWSAQYGLDDRTVFLYSGTLGMKHDPSLLLNIARVLSASNSIMMVVSEGPGVRWLANQGDADGALGLLPFQSAEDFPDMLAAGDVLVAVLEEAAGRFSVPSKILSYMCAGRPVLLVAPPDNPAARLILASGAGVVVPPADRRELEWQVRRLARNAELRAELGANGRAHAEREFRIGPIADTFEDIIASVATGS